MKLDGIHHITAITGDARRNLDFYTRVLGLRLIAKTVNQDDPSVYHLFYGDEGAHPGLDLTFFEYPGAKPGRAGAGMVHRVVWRVGGPEALDFWAARLGDAGATTRTGATDSNAGSHTGRTPGRTLIFADPEGLDHELVVTDAPDEPLKAIHPEIPAEHALAGFEGVRAYSFDQAGSVTVLENLMGAVATGDDTWEVRGEQRGGWIAYDPPPAGPGRQSAGTIHHVAWGTRDADYQGWLDRLDAAQVRNSGPVDRHYFHSIYFREPGGVLYELATQEPGFTVDGPVEELGRRVILPPFLEGRRDEIESILTPLPDPREEWPADVAPSRS